MKILPLVQNFNITKSDKLYPVFGANNDRRTDYPEYEEIIRALSNAVEKDELAQTIKKQLTNPTQKNVFFSTVASLITATAAQITELLTGAASDKDNNDIIEPTKSPQKVQNNSGNTFEADVADSDINNINYVKNKNSQTDYEVLEIIQNNKNLTDAYINIKQENPAKLTLVKKFIQDLNSLSQSTGTQVVFFSRLDNLYSEYLCELAEMHNRLKDDNADSVKNLYNRIISGNAIKEWNDDSGKYALTYLEYDSMVSNGFDDEAIKEIAKLKKDIKFKFIDVTSPEKYTIAFRYGAYTPIKTTFSRINEIFGILHKDSNRLNGREKDKYTSADIEYEIKKHINSYPNLFKHLNQNADEQIYLNRGKMNNLVDLYEGNAINRDLFTLHGYLRFVERIVMPAMNKDGNADEILLCRDINNMYISKLDELKKCLKDVFAAPFEVRTRTVGNMKAAQFYLPIKNSKGNDFLITINNKGKIHTIF